MASMYTIFQFRHNTNNTSKSDCNNTNDTKSSRYNTNVNVNGTNSINNTNKTIDIKQSSSNNDDIVGLEII